MQLRRLKVSFLFSQILRLNGFLSTLYRVCALVDKFAVTHLSQWGRANISLINNSNWTEWSAIWAKIIRVISKSNERAARVWFEIISMISDQNYTTRGSITTLLHPFWNRPNTGLGQFKHFIDAVLSRSENSSISWGEKVRVLETKVAKFATWYSLSFIFLQFDQLL